MQGVASLNDRCKDAVCHFELAWPPGERPTRPQWTDSALQTLKALGYEDHQYMIVAHDDKWHFHIHIMVNKVHPETLRAPTRYNNWLALDAAARLLEAKYGWAHTPGMTRWDEESKQAVPLSRPERNALRSARQQPTGAAAKFEHYHDEESLQSYVRQEVARVSTDDQSTASQLAALKRPDARRFSRTRACQELRRSARPVLRPMVWATTKAIASASILRTVFSAAARRLAFCNINAGVHARAGCPSLERTTRTGCSILCIFPAMGGKPRPFGLRAAGRQPHRRWLKA